MKPTSQNSGFTLLETMLSVVILAILAMLAVTSLFYPTGLVVNSCRKQSAINALNAGIERHLYNPEFPVTSGSFDTYGTPINVTTTTNLLADPIPGTIGDDADVIQIKAEIEYDNNTLELITYRSREVSGTKR